MAVDLFMNLDGIKGESADAKHKEEIDVLSWSWGASQSAPLTWAAERAARSTFKISPSPSTSTSRRPRCFSFARRQAHQVGDVRGSRKAGDKPLEYLTSSSRTSLFLRSASAAQGRRPVHRERDLNSGSFTTSTSPSRARAPAKLQHQGLGHREERRGLNSPTVRCRGRGPFAAFGIRFHLRGEALLAPVERRGTHISSSFDASRRAAGPSRACHTTSFGT